MKLGKQVTNLKLSKKLKELGVKQESLFVWRKHPMMADDASNAWNLVYLDGFTHYQKGDVSAFTVAELGERLPENIDLKLLTVCKGWTVLNHRRVATWVYYYSGDTGKVKDCLPPFHRKKENGYGYVENGKWCQC